MTDKYTYNDIKDEVDFCAHCPDPQEEYRIIVRLINQAYEEGKKDGACNNIYDCANQININLQKLKEENWELKSLLKEKMGCPHHVGDTCKCGWTNMEKIMHAKTLELERENFQLKEAINVFKITVKGIIK